MEFCVKLASRAHIYSGIRLRGVQRRRRKRKNYTRAVRSFRIRMDLQTDPDLVVVFPDLSPTRVGNF